MATTVFASSALRPVEAIGKGANSSPPGQARLPLLCRLQPGSVGGSLPLMASLGLTGLGCSLSAPGSTTSILWVSCIYSVILVTTAVVARAVLPLRGGHFRWGFWAHGQQVGCTDHLVVGVYTEA